MTEQVVIRRGAFHDPVTLMAAADEARSLQGVTQVAVGMADPLNLAIIRVRHGYDMGGEDSLGPEDLVIAVRADSDAAAEDALEVVKRVLAARRASSEVVDVGPYVFAGDLRGAPVQRIDWRAGQATVADAEPAVPDARDEVIARANDIAVGRMQDSRPLVVGVGVARDVLPGMSDRTLLHAGPPIDWADMTGPMRGAVIGAALFEGLADDAEDAMRKAEAGAFEFAPGHERRALGPMVGLISPSMPVWIVENDAYGNLAYCNFSEGYGQVLRFGAFGDAVIEHLRWMAAVGGPVIAAALERLPAPLDLRTITADALEMGDEVHNRNRAATSLVFRALGPALLEVDAPSADIADVARFIAHNDYFYLNLSMASGKATADAASGVEDSTIVTTMARNGTEFGLRMSGTGDRWFTAPSGAIRSLFRPGYSSEDASRDVGDSTITETIGLGGFAMAAAPAIAHFAGISPEDALRATLTMYDITWAESAHYRIPALGYRGSPVGIDCRKVAATGIAPVVNTGIAHRDPGVGVIGGGIVALPVEPFATAAQELADPGWLSA
ncbi:MAG: hypothetical protein QOC54_995 [Baekduia sp.]|jgi:hypothetical protein|nr:hypothetical protein [Baekduia sp.]